MAHIKAHTKIPVLGHADGVCHVFVHQSADPEKAKRIIVDAKTDYPAACNAMETLLLHAPLLDAPAPGGSGAGSAADALLAALRAAGVTLVGGPRAVAALSLPPAASLHAEYSALTACVEIVDDVAGAIGHIHAHGSGHTECIVSEDASSVAAFMAGVDAACVFHNASTRFADGFRFGLGAEVGISTSRLHARGPVGIEGLLTTRWLLRGDGHIVAKDAGVAYMHKMLPLPTL